MGGDTAVGNTNPPSPRVTEHAEESPQNIGGYVPVDSMKSNLHEGYANMPMESMPSSKTGHPMPAGSTTTGYVPVDTSSGYSLRPSSTGGAATPHSQRGSEWAL